MAALLVAGCESAEDRAEGHYQSGMELIEEGDVDRALVEFRNVFKLDPTHLEARRAYAEAVRARGDTYEAFSQYLRLVEQHPDDAEGRLATAELAIERQDWEAAERHGPRALAALPDAPRARAVGAALAYRDALQDEDAEARRAAAGDAARLSDELPENMALRRVVIDAAMQEGDAEAALAEIDAALEVAPDDLQLNRMRLGMLSELGRDDEIGEALLGMARRFPDDDEIKATLVRYHVSRGETDAAEEFLRSISDPTAEDPGAYVTLVRLIAETRGPEAAIMELESAIPTAADPATLRTLKAALVYQTGDPDAAIADLRSVLEEAEPSAQTDRIKVTLAKMLQETGNAVGARRLVEEVLEHDETQVDALKMQAARLISEDDADAAVATLRSALDQAPEDAEAMTLLAEAHLRAGNRSLARDMLALAVEASGAAPAETLRYAEMMIGEERWRPAEDVLVDALRLAPGNVDLLSALGRVYLGEDDLARAQGVIDRLGRIDTAEARAAKAAVEVPMLAGQDRREDAVALIEEMASSDDAGLGAQSALVRARLAEGDAEAALAAAETAAASDPQGGGMLRAATRAATGDTARAEEEFRALAEGGELGPRPWLSLVRLQARDGRVDEARATLDEAIGAYPDAPDLLWAKASYLERDGDVDAAIAIYEQLYEKNSASVVVANNLASLLATARDDDESIERAWRVARRLRGTEVANFQDTYGWIAFRRGRVDEAIEYLEPAAEGLAGDPMVQYHLARAYVAADRDADALEAFRRTVEVAEEGDGRSEIAEAREEIRRLEEETADADATTGE